jgi:hypothetical protein
MKIAVSTRSLHDTSFSRERNDEEQRINQMASIIDVSSFLVYLLDEEVY